MKLVNSEKKIQKPLVWLEISKKNLLFNVRQVRALIGKAKLMAAVKANAYGLGAVGVSKILEKEVSFFGVVGLKEALSLRESGINKPIINLGILVNDDAEDYLKSQIVPSVFTIRAARDLNKAAKRLNTKAEVWIKVDTGLGRLGVGYNEAAELIDFCAKQKNLKLTGVYSSLTEDADFDKEQLRRLEELKTTCQKTGIQIPYWSLSSSEALFFLSDTVSNVYRIGICLYGYYPSPEAKETKKLILKPVASFKTRVAVVKEIEKGESVFYRRKFEAGEATRIAVLLPGYTYGLDPRLVNGGEVLIKGQKFPLVGGISTTNCFVDLGNNTEIQANDEVVIFGRQKGNEITLETQSELSGQSEYEFLGRLPEKVERYFI